MPGNYDYNHLVKRRPKQVRAGPPRDDDASGKRVCGNAQKRKIREATNYRGNQT